jgi:hypothetical protein
MKELNLMELYAEFVNTNLELECSVDCGEKSVRESFSAFAELEEEISFDEMYELEKSL